MSYKMPICPKDKENYFRFVKYFFQETYTIKFLFITQEILDDEDRYVVDFWSDSE